MVNECVPIHIPCYMHMSYSFVSSHNARGCPVRELVWEQNMLPYSSRSCQVGETAVQELYEMKT
jgi:hypothetical protein